MLNQNTNRSGIFTSNPNNAGRTALRGAKGFLLLAAAALAWAGGPGGAAAATTTVTLKPWKAAQDNKTVVVESTGELGQSNNPRLTASFRNLEDHKIEFQIEWRDRNSLEQWLCSDVLTISGLNGHKVALEMTYDENVYNPVKDYIWSQTGEECIRILTGNGPAEKGGWEAIWAVNSRTGVFPMPQNAWPSNGLWNFQGTWAEAYAQYGEAAFTLGAFGVDDTEDAVWAVINRDGTYAPEPTSMFLLLAVAIPVIRSRRNRAASNKKA